METIQHVNRIVLTLKMLPSDGLYLTRVLLLPLQLWALTGTWRLGAELTQAVELNLPNQIKGQLWVALESAKVSWTQ